MGTSSNIDSPDRIYLIQDRINKKVALKSFYSDIYKIFINEKNSLNVPGKSVEIGSGGGFLKDLDSNIISSDLIAYPGLDMCFNALEMPFEDEELNFICMANVLHHISNPEKFFQETNRCLKSGGKLVLYDQYLGIFSTFIFKHLHNEEFDSKTESTEFDYHRPMSSANGALPYLIFFRDRKKFYEKFPNLEINKIDYHAPLKYWLSGGLREWNLIHPSFLSIIDKIDKSFLKINKNFASFFSVVIQKL